MKKVDHDIKISLRKIFTDTNLKASTFLRELSGDPQRKVELSSVLLTQLVGVLAIFRIVMNESNQSQEIRKVIVRMWNKLILDRVTQISDGRTSALAATMLIQPYRHIFDVPYSTYQCILFEASFELENDFPTTESLLLASRVILWLTEQIKYLTGSLESILRFESSSPTYSRTQPFDFEVPAKQENDKCPDTQSAMQSSEHIDSTSATKASSNMEEGEGKGQPRRKPTKIPVVKPPARTNQAR